MALTKDRITESIYHQYGFSKKKSGVVLESLLEIIKKTLESGEDVLICRFGKFCVREKNERHVRNPQTGDGLTLGARRVVTFRCSPKLKESINRKE